MTPSPPVTRLAVSADALTCVDLVGAVVDKHTLMTRDKHAAAAALHELDVLLSLQPRAATGHVVALRSFRLDAQDQRLHVLLEHCARGDLFRVAQDETRLLQAQLLAPHHGLTTCERSLQRVAYQTLRGLCTLHANGIAHTDLSLENVFVTASGDIRIGDFALAQRFRRGADGRVLRQPTTQAVAKPAYAAPELYARSVQDVTKADAWALGVLLWHLVTRSPLFPTGAATPGDPVFRAIVKSTTWASSLLPQASAGLRDLLTRLLDPNPATRLSVDAALRHAWLRKLSPPVAPSPAHAKMAHETKAKAPLSGRVRTASAEISLDATRVAIRPSRRR